MTDRLITNSQELRAEGDDLRIEIDRHAKNMYERIERMETRLRQELLELSALKNRFGWVAPEKASGNRGLEAQQKVIGVVSGNQGGTGGRS